VFVPLMTPLVFLMGIGRSRAGSRRASRPVAAAALGTCRQRGHGTRVCRSSRPWAPDELRLAAPGVDRDDHHRQRDGAQPWGPWRRGHVPRAATRSYWAWSSRISVVAVFIIGVTMVRSYETERDVRHGRRRHRHRGRLHAALRRHDRHAGPITGQRAGPST
jgi:cytochrome c biogenesis factor